MNSSQNMFYQIINHTMWVEWIYHNYLLITIIHITITITCLIRILINITEMEKLERLKEVKAVLNDFQEVQIWYWCCIYKWNIISIWWIIAHKNRLKNNMILSEPTNTVVIIIYTLLVTFAGDLRWLTLFWRFCNPSRMHYDVVIIIEQFYSFGKSSCNVHGP